MMLHLIFSSSVFFQEKFTPVPLEVHCLIGHLYDVICAKPEGNQKNTFMGI